MDPPVCMANGPQIGFHASHVGMPCGKVIGPLATNRTRQEIPLPAVFAEAVACPGLRPIGCRVWPAMPEFS